ncbi:MAG: hypothetical protein IPJ81_14610 [Chitinophagaceae bacterium]|nr:hypothetical protein [Chitinophagaceae bacterium]
MIFLGLIGLSILSAFTIIIIALIKNKKIIKPYSLYLLSLLVPLIIGITGCLTIDHLTLGLENALDNGGAILIAVLSIASSFWISIKVWKKVKREQDLLDY